MRKTTHTKTEITADKLKTSNLEETEQTGKIIKNRTQQQKTHTLFRETRKDIKETKIRYYIKKDNLKKKI